MDPFTEKLLERTRQRRENLARKMSSKESPQPTLPLSRKRPSPLTEMTANWSVNDGETPLKRQAHVPPDSKADVTPEQPRVGTLRSRLGKLAARHQALSSDVEDPDSAPSPSRSERTPPVGENVPPQPAARKSRFAALASTINNWEDDLTHHVPKTRAAALAESQPVPSPRQSAPSNTSPIPAKPPRGMARSPLTVAAAGSPRASPIMMAVSPVTSPVKASPLKPPRKQVASRFISPSKQLETCSPSNHSPVKSSPVRVENSPVRMTRSRSRTSMGSPSMDEPTAKPVSARMGMWEQRVQNAGGTLPSTPGRASPKRSPKSSPNRGLASPVRLAASPVRLPASPVRLPASPVRLPASPVRIAASPRTAVSPGRPLASPVRAMGLASPALASPPSRASPLKAVHKSPTMRTPTKSDNYVASCAKRELSTPEKVGSKVAKTMSFSDSIAARAREFEEAFEPKRQLQRNNSRVGGDRTRQLQDALIDKTQNSWKKNEISSKIGKEKTSDLEVVKNRWNNGVKADVMVGSQDEKKPIKKINMYEDEDDDGRMNVDDEEGFHAPVAHLSNQARQAFAKPVAKDAGKSKPVAKDAEKSKPFAKDAEKSKSRAREEARAKKRSEFENKLAAMGFEVSTSPVPTQQKYNTIGGRSRQKFSGREEEEEMETEQEEVGVATTSRLRHRSEQAPLVPGPRVATNLQKAEKSRTLPPGGQTGHKIWARVKTFESGDAKGSEGASLRRRHSSARRAYTTTAPAKEENEIKVRFSSKVDMAPTPVMQDYSGTESDFSESDSFLQIEAKNTVTVSQGQGQGHGQGQGYSSMESDSTDMLESIEQTMGNTHYPPMVRSASSSSSTLTEGESEEEPRDTRAYEGDYSTAEQSQDETDHDVTENAEELCAEMDDLLDSMVNSEDDDVSLVDQGAYNVRTRTTAQASYPTSASTSQTRATSSYDETEDGRTSPLVYSISAYRSMRSNKRHPPAKMHIVREPEREQVTSQQKEENVRQKIQKLQDLVKQEQAIIIQTTNALNQCCSKNSAFAGSQEQVECNKLLLIACQRRQAYIEEIEHLKQGKTKSNNSTSECHGSLTISDIRLPLKREFLSKIGLKEDTTVHYFLLLLRNGPHLIVTEMVSSHDGGVRSRGLMEIPNLIKLNDIRSDFNFVLEIYSMSVVREPDHEKTKKKSGFTPKKLLSKKKHAESPVTVMSVSTTNFRLISTVPITLKSVHNSTFTLQRVPSLCPLQGVINMKLRCILESTVEERGFLTMFEDVSGFGAWHRRWCVLQNNKIKYWKYPDDEKNKESIGTIDLKSCITGDVGLIPRDICARPNTFELITLRPPQSGDRNTLVSWKYDTLMKFRHMLSADTKQDRLVWCDKINETLLSIRTWQPDALPAMKPDNSNSSR